MHEPAVVNERRREGNRRGFPAGARQVPVPGMFFSDVLPEMSDQAELLVSLYAFSLASRRRPAELWFAASELRAEAPLMRALARLEEEPAAALQRGLALAIARGTLVAAERAGKPEGARLYAVNSPRAREALASVSELLPAAQEDASAVGPVENIFVLYEENIGVISPLLAEQLREAQSEYPWPWIEAAFREAVALNRRNWRYIERILARWRAEGPDREAIRRSAEGSRRSLAGRYWRLVRR